MTLLVLTLLVLIVLGLVTIGGTVVTCTFDPARQAVALSVYGVLLSILFLALAAPDDVALSQVAVDTAVVPLMVLLLAVRTVRATKSAGIAVLLGFAVARMPAFGGNLHPYRDSTVAAALAQRALNVATSINFDQRGLDTFVAQSGTYVPLLCVRP